MPPERSPLSMVNEIFSPSDASLKDFSAIERLRTQGRSLGASIALHMLNESSNALDSFIDSRLFQEPEPSMEEVFAQYIATSFYGMTVRSIFDAEEVIRSGEPESLAAPTEEAEKVGRLLSLSLGANTAPLKNELTEMLAETKLYLNKKRYGDILQRTNSPTQVVDAAFKDIANGLEAVAKGVSQSHNVGHQKTLAIAALSCAYGKERFKQLYEEAQERGIS